MQWDTVQKPIPLIKDHYRGKALLLTPLLLHRMHSLYRADLCCVVSCSFGEQVRQMVVV